MPQEHTSMEAMRAYLLGRLPQEQANALEAEYFTDRAVFLKTQAAETDLIQEYLDGGLPAEERQCFESRYLKIPELQRRVEEVKLQRGSQRPTVRPGLQFGWRPALAMAFVVMLATGLWIYRSRGNKPPVQIGNHQDKSGGNPGTRIAAVFYVSPGLTKGPDSKPVQFEAPAASAAVLLVLELPGQRVPVHKAVRILRARTDGGRDLVWDRTDILSESVQGTQSLILKLSGTPLEPGDYVVEVSAADGDIYGKYVYRVT